MLNIEEIFSESRAFSELEDYLITSVDEGKLLLKLHDLHTLYVQRFWALAVNKPVHNGRLKDKLLSHFPDAQAQSAGKYTALIFQDGLCDILRYALEKRDCIADAEVLLKAAKIIRNYIFGYEGFTFNGSFPSKCQEESVPPSLKLFVSMLINGRNLKNQDTRDSQSCLTISQLMMYNSKKTVPDPSTHTRHTHA